MPRCLPPALMLLLGCLAALAVAAPPQDGKAEPAAPAEAVGPAADAAEPAAEKPRPASFVSVVKERSGRRTLAIDYRWKVHADASIEVRLVAAGADDSLAAPVYFHSEYFRGDVKLKAYHCHTAADKEETTDSFVQDNTEFKIVGRRNSLGRPAVLVLPRDQAKKAHGGSPEFVVTPKAVFLLLDSWAVNDHLLALDLPRAEFSEPGTLHVWFLRSERVVWEETVPWPGYGKQ